MITRIRSTFRSVGLVLKQLLWFFADEDRIEYYDKIHSIEEDRWVALGCVQGILYVVYTMRMR